MKQKFDSAVGLIFCIVIHVSFYFIPKFSNDQVLSYLPLILWSIILSIIVSITMAQDYFVLHPAIIPVLAALAVMIVLLCIDYRITMMISFGALLSYLYITTSKFGMLRLIDYEAILGGMFYIYIFTKRYFMNKDVEF